MFSSKDNVNILTSLLRGHHIRNAVVCPGSRNAPIVHNLCQCCDISCYPVTDERSAGFFALGIAQDTDEPVVVCVTSGTALLNLCPAVAEASYQHQSLIIISADRPQEWIGQLDGQTLQQPGALSPWVSRSVTLPEVGSPQSAWHCNRLVNEALTEATSNAKPCVHINVPISEPLFHFTTEELPRERVIMRHPPIVNYDSMARCMMPSLMQAQRPLIVFGQFSPRRFFNTGLDELFGNVIILHEALSPLDGCSPIDEALASLDGNDSELERLHPDFILHVGDAIVSKRLKHFLRQATEACTWRISPTDDVEDTFQNLRNIITGDTELMLKALSGTYGKQALQAKSQHAEYRRRWLLLLKEARRRHSASEPSTMEAAAVAQLERWLQIPPYRFDVHYANSTAVRLANIYAVSHPVWCNRGTNGIEGSLSTAVGFAASSMASDSPHTVFCVIGDLSFFYDQNALWNSNTAGNLRILLLNNGHGAIFDLLPGLSQSPVADTHVAGRHQATARGICQQNGVDYRECTDTESLHDAVEWLIITRSTRPMLLEVRQTKELNDRKTT